MVYYQKEGDTDSRWPLSERDFDMEAEAFEGIQRILVLGGHTTAEGKYAIKELEDIVDSIECGRSFANELDKPLVTQHLQWKINTVLFRYLAQLEAGVMGSDRYKELTRSKHSIKVIEDNKRWLFQSNEDATKTESSKGTENKADSKDLESSTTAAAATAIIPLSQFNYTYYCTKLEFTKKTLNTSDRKKLVDFLMTKVKYYGEAGKNVMANIPYERRAVVCCAFGRRGAEMRMRDVLARLFGLRGGGYNYTTDISLEKELFDEFDNLTLKEAWTKPTETETLLAVAMV